MRIYHDSGKQIPTDSIRFLKEKLAELKAYRLVSIGVHCFGNFSCEIRLTDLETHEDILILLSGISSLVPERVAEVFDLFNVPYKYTNFKRFRAYYYHVQAGWVYYWLQEMKDRG